MSSSKNSALPITPTTVPIGISYGNSTSRPTMSQTSTKAAPVSITQGSVRRRLSPMTRLTRLGTIRPRNGTTPAVTMTLAVTMATITRPSATSRP
jgi:hypothetical protein